MSDSDRAATDTQFIASSVAALLAEAGRSSKYVLEPLKGGRNNRTYRVRAESGDYLLKWYFSHHDDSRDRLATEFDFCSYLWQQGVRQIPQPLCANRSTGMGLYEFLPGNPLTASGVTLQHHNQAITFLRDINAARLESDAMSLANASEACFSLAGHVERIGARLQRLMDIAANDELDREMVEFTRSQLRPAFERQHQELEQWATHDKLDMRADLGTENRLLSPSDFGFHNALLCDDGALRFFDFEYAGWDDAAKLVGDFFCQIEVPALAIGFDEFLGKVSHLFTQPEVVRQRARRLFPLYQIKWCCIVLNDFLPTDGARRSFSDSDGAESKRTEQLAIARRLLERVGCVPGSE